MMSETENYTQLETDTAPTNSEETQGGQTNLSENELHNEDIMEVQDNELNQQEADNSSASVEVGLEQETVTQQTEVEEKESDTEVKITALEAEIASLKSQLEKQTEQTQSVQNQYMRLNADFDNFRRRTSKEKEELEQRAKKKTILELLPIVDNFERARSQIKPANDGEMAIHKSYQGVYKTFVEALKKIGVSAMRPEGNQFDPTYHEAMLREPTNEHPEGTVIEQLVRGYLLGDEVLRHAMVKVATEAEQGTSEEISSEVVAED